MRAAYLASVCACAACGRIDFGARADAAPIDSVDAPPPTPPHFVQHHANNVGVTSLSDTFGNPVVAGDLLVAAFDYATAPGTNPMAAIVEDSRSNAYTVLGPFDGTNGAAGNRQYVAYAIARDAGIDTITVTLDGPSSGYFELRLHEYANVDSTTPVDAFAGGSGSTGGTDAAQSDAIVTSEPNELLFGFVIDGIVSAGTGFTLRGNDYNDVTEDAIAVTPGTYRTIATPNGTWTATIVAFRGR